METIDFAPAASLSLEALADLFTRSFEQYFYPGTMTAADLAARVRVEQIDLWRSTVLRVAEEPAGLALLAVRPGEAWCGGFGIVLARRGQGLAQQLADAMVSGARVSGAPKLRLEVLARNERAVRVYRRAGFRTLRDLLVLEWRRPEGHAPAGTPVMGEAEPRALLRHFDALHRQPAAWQRDLPALLARSGLRGYALGPAESPRAYALVQPAADGAARIADLAATDEGAARVVADGLQARYARLISVNEPEGSPQALALAAAGFAEVDRQHEMELSMGG